ncbi:hypothetical protein [Alteromonas mediterranea]|nr:hypothetical protein [Alteromonas mediterranea]
MSEADHLMLCKANRTVLQANIHVLSTEDIAPVFSEETGDTMKFQ